MNIFACILYLIMLSVGQIIPPTLSIFRWTLGTNPTLENKNENPHRNRRAPEGPRKRDPGECWSDSVAPKLEVGPRGFETLRRLYMLQTAAMFWI